METVNLRPIEPGDDQALARVIRSTLEEFKANHPGTVYYDSSTDHLSELFQTPRSKYFVLLEGNRLMGGAGIFPSEGLPEGTCELVKMYLITEARGKGYGKMLMNKAIEFAKEAGFKKVYLETMPELIIAIPMYEKMGFEYLPKQLGNTGHFGCAIWMEKAI